MWRDGLGRSEQGVEGSSMHEIRADEAGEGERAVDDLGGVLSEAQDEEGDEGYGDLDAHGVLGSAEEVTDFEGLLDPAEEQFDLPAALVEVGNFLGGGVEIVGQDAQLLAGLGIDADFTDGIGEGVLTASCQAGGKVTDAVGEDRRARRKRLLLDDDKRGVFVLSRVTIRQPF